jgi:hypothetical protein
MNLDSERKLVWGWFRLLLGLAQMGLAAAGFVLLIMVGVQIVTVLFLLGATAATIASRLLYAGRRGPQLKEGENHD